MSLFIGIDSGTQSTKTIVLDTTTGQVVATARASHRMIPGLPPGHAEQDPKEWTAALDMTLEAVIAKVEPQRIQGIGVGGQQHGFVALDESADVIRPAKLWCDTSTVEECTLLTQELGGTASIIRELGLPFLPGYTAPKILWLKRNEPANFKRLRQVLLPHDYLNYYLTGHYTAEAGDASGTALLNVRQRTWSTDAANAIDRNLIEFLPQISHPQTTIGVVRPQLAQRLGLPPATRVSTGGGDNMMSAIGTGTIREGIVSLSLGTSGTVYAYSERPLIDPNGEIAAFCDSTGAWLPLCCTMNVTRVIDHFASLFGFDKQQFEEAVRAVPAGAQGLRLLPYLDGERTPNLPQATGMLSGITHRNLTPQHMARAALEGVARGLQYGLKRFQKLGLTPTEIRLTGGCARSVLWRQTLADLFGIPVIKIAADEGAALGAAIHAAWMVEKGNEPRGSLSKLIERLVHVDESTRCIPDPDTHVLYQS